MSWIQIKIGCCRADSETIEATLLATGALSITLQDAADQPILEPAVGETPLWDACLVTGLYTTQIDREYVDACVKTQHDGIELSWEKLAEKQWTDIWKQDFFPLRCGEHLWICPSWRSPPDASKVNLILDPGMAFGTGSHPTTFMCLQWLDGQSLSQKTVIDYGCGSGILGIAALLLGASNVIAVDNDPQALAATRSNAERNSIPESNLQCYLPHELPKNSSAQVMLANILAAPLIALAPQLTAMTTNSGALCLSGILNEQIDTVCAAYNSDFSFYTPKMSADWAQLHGHKRLT